MKLVKNNQFWRSLLTNSFLFKMVQMRRCFLTTCTKPVHEEKNIKQMCRFKQESGRSMVEMLGVLAIIGVLSVGAIAGYSKAMEKYKLNKFTEQLSIISQNIKTLCFGKNTCSEYWFHSGSNAPYINEGREILKKTNAIPDNMWSSPEYIKNNYQGDVHISWSSNYISIEYNKIPKDACAALGSLNWGNNSLGVSKLTIYATNQGHDDPYLIGYSRNHNIEHTELSMAHPFPIPIDAVHNYLFAYNHCSLTFLFENNE